jgi:hypothetical protein
MAEVINLGAYKRASQAELADLFGVYKIWIDGGKPEGFVAYLLKIDPDSTLDERNTLITAFAKEYAKQKASEPS